MDELSITTDHLNAYVVAFSWKLEKEWFCNMGCIFAKSEDDIPKILTEKYGAVCIRSVCKLDISEGTILYGSTWHVC